MNRIICLFILLGMTGCASLPSSLSLPAGLSLPLSLPISLPTTAKKLELFFSPEQVTLTAEQHRKIIQFLKSSPSSKITATVGPATLKNKFEALLQSQKRMHSIEQLASAQKVPLTLEFSPKITPNTLLIRSK